MEIIFELILGLLEGVISVVGEILLEVFGQILIELGLHSLDEIFTSRYKKNPYLAFIGYALFGLIIGGISLLILKTSLIKSPELRLLNLCITPFMGGLAMSLIGRMRLKKGQDLIRLDSFSYGFIFAFAVAIVRYYKV